MTHRPPDHSVPGTPKQSRRRWSILTWIRIGVVTIAIVVLSGGFLYEHLAWRNQQASIGQLKAYVRSLGPNGRLERDEIRKHLVGSPQQLNEVHTRKEMVIYRWPGILKKYQIRALVSAQGNVLYVDQESMTFEDFMQPFIVGNNNGIQVHDRLASEVALDAMRQSHQPSTIVENLLAETRDAFSRPPADLAPGVVIFPVVDEHDLITTSGAAISMTAQSSVISGPDKRMDLDPALVRLVLLSGNCWEGGQKLDDDKVQLCLNEMSRALHIRPRQQQTAGGPQIVVELPGLGDRAKSTLTVPVYKDDLGKTSGELALGILDHFGLPLTKEQRNWIAHSQFQSEESARQFGMLAAWPTRDPGVDQTYERATTWKNRDWVAAYDVLKTTNTGVVPSRLAHALSPHVKRSFEDSRYPHFAEPPSEALKKLLSQAAVLRNSPCYFWHLIRQARRLNDRELLTLLFEIWEKEGTDYASRVIRAREMIDAAWNIERAPLPDAVPVTDKELFRERIQRARRELETAIRLNPRGWTAHTEMIRIATIEGEPFAVMQDHFESALRSAPNYNLPWEYKCWYLQPHWHGNSDQRVQFARECLAAGHTSGTRRYAASLILDDARDRKNATVNYQHLGSERSRALLQEYFQVSEQSPSEDVQRTVKNLRALYAGMTGHGNQLPELFAYLDDEIVLDTDEDFGGMIPPDIYTNYQESWFASDGRYFELRDLALAEDTSTSLGAFAATRVALAGDDLEAAKQALGKIGPKSEQDQAEYARLDRAIAFAQRLRQEQRIEIYPELALELFASVSRTRSTPLKQVPRWSLDGTDLLLAMPTYNHEGGWIDEEYIVFPVGIQHGTISGTIVIESTKGQFEVCGHTYARRDPVELRYTFNQLAQAAGATMSLVRNRYQLQSAAPFTQPIRFQLDYKADQDVFSPTPGVRWQTPVIDHVPSSFGFRLPRADQDAARVRIRNLVITRNP